MTEVSTRRYLAVFYLLARMALLVIGIENGCDIDACLLSNDAAKSVTFFAISRDRRADISASSTALESIGTEARGGKRKRLTTCQLRQDVGHPCLRVMWS